MTPAERLILYVVRRIQDEGGWVSRTRLLKMLYLIDVEYYRRHRKTLTGWPWVFYLYGPYVHEFPRILSKLGLSLEETHDTTTDGWRYFGYRTEDEEDIDDLVSATDQVVIDDIVARWSLEDLNLLLSHVYFRTEPMRDARRGEPLDFGAVRRRFVARGSSPTKKEISPESIQRFRTELEQARLRRARQREAVRAHVASHPFELDSAYRAMMATRDDEESRGLPDGIEVTVEADEQE